MSKVEAYIKGPYKSNNNKFEVADPKGNPLALTYVKVNRGALKKLKVDKFGDEYLQTAVFKNDASNELVEVDFILKGADAVVLRVQEFAVRKVGNKSFYNWKLQNNHLWVKEYSETNEPSEDTTPTVVAGSGGADQPKVVVCAQDVDAFNVSDPKQLLGKFMSGSSLTIESRHESSGMFLVVYKHPDGSEVRALCRPQDLSL